MKIPKKFKLYGHTINVVYDEKLMHEKDNRGEARYRDYLIKLMPVTTCNLRPLACVEETFCHELMHFILYKGGYEKENEDEQMVDRLGNLLHQALTTMEYED